ncbi:diguanylate cyclase [Sulfurimonas sp.]|uniref:diguanylate cyclase domain-containing protein n=1 Tax=Sulfurimonas sp. TaxID=2022749 RepID=UPI0025D946C7|nr:diguanylate cyclase [Sulfurimonas sp.]
MKRILCVDDIQANLFTLEALFETNYSDKYSVVTAMSGKEALEILLFQKIDLILLDVMMPDIDGYETAKFILSNKKTKDIPIVFLTAKKDQDTVSRCYEVGGVDYLSKPYNEQELFVRIKFHLDLIENKRVLEIEKKLSQDILDMQDNMVIVSDGSKMIKINRTVNEFFKFKDFKNEKYCICKHFVEEEGYFHLGFVEKTQQWIDILLKMLEKKDVLVLMKNIDTLELNSFDIKAKKFGKDFLITLTDITSFDAESKYNEHEAYYDSLTNIYNRTKLNDLFSKQIQKAKTYHNPFAFLMLDIDYFKAVNDNYGHLLGDEVLIDMTKIIKSNIRESDIFARWGGEEFVLILPSVDLKKAEEIANYLRIKIQEYDFAEIGKITCSFGLTLYKDEDCIDSIIKRADVALYDAKDAGRNKVCILS